MLDNNENETQKACKISYFNTRHELYTLKTETSLPYVMTKMKHYRCFIQKLESKMYSSFISSPNELSL